MESSYVMSLLKRFSTRGTGDSDELFKADLLSKVGDILGTEPGEFKCAFVMPKATQNLDNVYRQERPFGAEARRLMYEVGVCLRHIHNKHLIHGDLKMLNVVRFQDRLRLVDMDSSIILKGGGAKYFGVPGNFSTGLLPPEMIYTFRDAGEIRAYEDYFESFKGSDEGKELYDSILQPQKGDEREDKRFCYRAYNPVKSACAPPYALVEASESLDMWAFACMIYNVCASCQLFLADCDDNLCPGAIEHLASWDDETKEKLVLTNVTDPLAQDLLCIMLSKKEEDRFPHMEAVLAHPFFAESLTKEENAMVVGRVRDKVHAMEEKKRREKVLIMEKNTKLKRVRAEDQYILDRTVSSTLDSMFGCGFDTPKAFFILPKRPEGNHLWLEALDNVIKLLSSEVEGAGDATSPSAGAGAVGTSQSTPPRPPTPKVTSIRDELFKALEIYGETRFNLFWVDEISGDAKRDQKDVVIEMSFLNALKFAPLMVLSCKLLFRQFGLEGLAKMLLVEEGEVPFSFSVPFDAVDAVFEFDQFQSHVDSYGLILDENEEEEEEEGQAANMMGDEKKMELQDEGVGEVEPNGTPKKKKKKKKKEQCVSSWNTSVVLPSQMSPVKLSKKSHLSHLADYDFFVSSRDPEFSFAGLVRGVGVQCCAWTSLEACEKIVEMGSKEAVREYRAATVSGTSELAKLKAEVNKLKEKERRLELSEMDVSAMERANASLKETILRLEEEVKEETRRREKEHLAEKERLAKEIESTTSSTGEILEKKNAMLKR